MVAIIQGRDPETADSPLLAPEPQRAETPADQQPETGPVPEPPAPRQEPPAQDRGPDAQA